MQKSRTRKQEILSESAPASVSNSPYRMGNWTVTMLKEELRAKQLPITGKKAELIDRLENSPVKSAAAPNTKRSPLKGDTVKVPGSPASSIKNIVVEATSRGRSRSPSRTQSASPHRMLTRSRSTSLSRGTFLTWSSQPFSVLGNFILAQFDGIKENVMFFGALTAFLAAISALLYFNLQYRNIFLEQASRAQPVLQVFLDGFTSTLGLSRSEFSAYISKAARFMYDCSSGNIERNSSTGRLRCSASPLKFTDFGLPGRLFWLTREQFVAWTLGTLTASALVFFVCRKCRTALPLQTNATVHKILKFSAKNVYFSAAFLPSFETTGLNSGLSGFNGKQFFSVLAVKIFIGIPLKFAASILIAKNQKSLNSILSHLPVFFLPLKSVNLLWARQTLNAAIYTFICAAAIQVIANSRLYNKNYRINTRR